MQGPAESSNMWLPREWGDWILENTRTWKFEGHNFCAVNLGSCTAIRSFAGSDKPAAECRSGPVQLPSAATS
jgi:hypothetical protein